MFVHVKVYYQKCPQCGAKFNERLSQSSVLRVGKETYVCRCNTAFDTGKKEWAHLSVDERRGYFFSQAEIGVMLISAVVPGVFGYFVGSGIESAVSASAWGFLFGAAFVGILWTIKTIIVKTSLRRCPHEPGYVAGVPPWCW